MDKTQEIIDWLKEYDDRVRDALFLIKLEYDAQYKHAYDWYDWYDETPRIKAAKDNAEKKKYEELKFQLDMYGAEGSKDAWFSGMPEWNIFLDATDTVDWPRVESELRNAPLVGKLSKG